MDEDLPTRIASAIIRIWDRSRPMMHFIRKGQASKYNEAKQAIIDELRSLLEYLTEES